MKKGALIAGVGLPGCGKSGVFAALAKEIGAPIFLEPEEPKWDRAVTSRDKYGHIGGIHWFRCQRVPNLIDAREAADRGRIAFVDSYYDKLCSYYLGKPGMEWLLDPNDPYFENFLRTAQIDLETLPDADCIVSFFVSEEDWKRMVEKRGRTLDEAVALKQTFYAQKLFEEAASRYAARSNAIVIEFQNMFCSVPQSAMLLKEKLIEKGLIARI